MNLPLTKKLGRPSKRLPEFLSLLLFMLLCACTAYWVMQLIKPPLRAVTAPPQAEQAQVDVSLAAGLFGGRGTVTVASNYQLLGVVAAKKDEDSVAILSADGKPAQAVRQGKELLPGTSIKEVHATYVLLSEGGVLKRVMLPEDVRSKSGMVSPAPIPASGRAPAAAPNQDLPPEQPAVPVQDK
ncbi:general secretion pathway protein C [Collimonas sp. OK307]|uniref:type II secretion system protein N n=1 Tax=Collimonas sp. OK307 TaxID=1801620 RepID=UPI0008F2943E|nr:type II secretion system protein N [Collimonas sp. OK307]SFH83705.1 general secretion pathway protein C [Collimonas sp. OK307]